MARAENKSEKIVYHEVVNPTTAVVVRQIEDSKGRHFLDVRQFFKPDAEDDTWNPTRMGVRLNHAGLDAIKKVTLPKNPVDTKTVTTRIDPGIKLPSDNGSAKVKAQK